MATIITPSKSDAWGTPVEFFMKLDYEFNFTLDPCADPRRCLKAGIKEYYITDDGLNHSWKSERVYCNPPYTKSQVKHWVKKAYLEKNDAEAIVLLIPVHTDRVWFHEYVWDEKTNQCRPGVELRFVKGRLTFRDLEKGKPGTSAQQLSMVVIMRATEAGK